MEECTNNLFKPNYVPKKDIYIYFREDGTRRVFSTLGNYCTMEEYPMNAMHLPCARAPVDHM